MIRRVVAKKTEPGPDLLPEDKKKIEKLSEKKLKHLKSIEELNRRIMFVQNSTGTLFPRFVRLHNQIRQKYRWYYNWHTKPYTPFVHWLVLGLYLIGLPVAYWFLAPKVEVTKAGTATALIVSTTPLQVSAGTQFSLTVTANNNDPSDYKITCGAPNDSKADGLPNATTATGGNLTTTSAVLKTAGTQSVSCTGTKVTPPDTTAPGGLISLNPNNSAANGYQPITNITITASDNSGTVASMQITNSQSYSVDWNGNPGTGWIPYATSRPNWNVTNYGGGANPGTKIVLIRFKDGAGNISYNASASFTYDLAPEDAYLPLPDKYRQNIVAGGLNFKPVPAAIAAGEISGSTTISVTPAGPAKMSFTGFPSIVQRGEASSAITLQLIDAYDNYTAVGTTQAIHLSSSSSGGRFSESPGGPWQRSPDFNISAGSGTLTFYYLDSTGGTPTITASETPDAGWSDASGALTVEAGPTPSPSAIILTPTPTPSATEQTTITFTPSPPSTTPSPGLITQPIFEPLIDHPVAQNISRSLNPLTTTAAAISFLPLLVQAFPSAFHGLASLFPALFTAFAIRRRRKPWGMVFDSLTGQPIDLAVIRIFDAEAKKLVGTKVTDANGRFTYLLSRGKYYINVSKPGYIFPPQISRLKVSQISTRFGPDSDLYIGEPFTIRQDDTNINLSIALDRISTLSFDTKARKVLQNSFDWFLIGLSYVALPLLIIGAILAIFAMFVIPSKFNLYLNGVYLVLLIGYIIANQIHRTRLGLVFNSKTGKPIARALVTIIDNEYKAVREIKTTDKYGRFSILAPKGQFYLTVDARGYNFPAKPTPTKNKKARYYFGEVITNKKAAYLNANIPLDKK